MTKQNTLLLSISIVLFQVLVFFPLFIWIKNSFNFSINVLDSIDVFIYIVVFILVFSYAITRVLPKKLHNSLLKFFVLLSVLIFIQQNLFVVNYGVLDGKNLDFSMDSFVKWFDIAIWLVAFILMVIYKDMVIKNAGVLLTFSGLVPVLILLNTLYSYDYESPSNSGSITEENKFMFSKSKNVLVFLLDGFQSDFFWEIIDKEPKIKNDFSGFKFYPNTSSVFAKTYPTIPLVLTGNIYQKQLPIMDFINESYEDSILTDLKSSGWDVGLYPHAKNLIKVDEANMDNYSNSIDTIDKVDNYLQSLDLSLFRSVPHMLKKKIYNDGNFIVKEGLFEYIKDNLIKNNNRKVFRLPRVDIHPGKNFLENLNTFSSLDSNKPTFRFYHLLMPHSPYLLNRELEYGNYENNFTSFQNYAYASVSLMASYINELKKLDVYNETAIIIVADHGGGEYTNKQYDHVNDKYVTIENNGNAIASGKPLLLVKGYDDNKPFMISNKPISLTDIAPTISQFTDVALKNKNGEPINKIKEKQKRERLYYFYNFTGWDSKYLNDFNIFKINGNVYDENSWTTAGVLNTVQTSENKNYVLGKTMRFGRDIKHDADYSNKFIVGDDFTFSHSRITSKNKHFKLSIPFEEKLKEKKTYVLGFELLTSEQEAIAYIKSRGKILTSRLINYSQKEQYFLVSLDEVNINNILDLEIYIEDDNPTNKLILSKLKIQGVENSDIRKLENNFELSFSDELQGLNPKGFWKKEEWGRWTKHTESSISFRTDGNFCDNSYLKVNIQKFYADVDPNEFEVLINSQPLTPIKSIINKSYQLFYDCHSFNHNKIINLTFKTNKTVSPAETNKGNDVRKLGIALSSIQIVKKNEVLK